MPSAPPMTRPITGAQRPTTSDMRAPWISRESSSRPSPSVPSQCAAENGARRCSISMSVGLGSGSTVAKIATANTKIIQIIAAQNSMPSRRLLRTRAATASSARSSSSVAMADPRIEHGGEHVDDEVHDDEAGGDQQHDALQDDQVAREDRADQQPADAGKGKNRLDDDGAANQPTDIDAGDRHQSQRRGFERMHEQDARRLQALGLGE